MVFDQIKKIAELKKLQNSFKQEINTVEKNGISVTINGNFEVEEIKLNPELSLQDQQETLKKCLKILGKIGKSRPVKSSAQQWAPATQCINPMV